MRSPVGNKGFTLIEVLVALTILAISLSVVMSGISRGLQMSRKSELQTLAMGLAQSLLAQVGVTIPVRVGDTTGATGAFSWRIHAEPYGVAGGTPHPALVSISVAWTEDDRPQALQIRTLRLMREDS